MVKTDFEELYEILCESFPRDELREKEDFMKLASNPAYKVYTEKKNEKIIGFIGFWKLTDLIFVEYFAVRKEFRGNGAGSEILRRFLLLQSDPVCLEVEERGMTEFASRRIAFYERMGFFTNPYPYLQPAYSPDKKLLPLIVMTYPAPVSEDSFRAYRRMIYPAVYGKNTED